MGRGRGQHWGSALNCGVRTGWRDAKLPSCARDVLRASLRPQCCSGNRSSSRCPVSAPEASSEALGLPAPPLSSEQPHTAPAPPEHHLWRHSRYVRPQVNMAHRCLHCRK